MCVLQETAPRRGKGRNSPTASTSRGDCGTKRGVPSGGSAGRADASGSKGSGGALAVVSDSNHIYLSPSWIHCTGGSGKSAGAGLRHQRKGQQVPQNAQRPV